MTAPAFPGAEFDFIAYFSRDAVFAKVWQRYPLAGRWQRYRTYILKDNPK
jgi:hypothetical protein